MSVSLNTIYAVVLGGALLHASWNAIIKGSEDKLLSAVGVAIAAAVVAAALLPWLSQPAAASWPFLLTSLALQLSYMLLLTRIYVLTDMGISYPLMRGTAPLLVAAVSVIVLDDVLSAGMLAGIACLCAGIFFMAMRSGQGGMSRLGRRLVFANALVIASYTLVDGLGARLSGAPLAYTLWIFLLQGLGMWALGRVRRHKQLTAYLRRHWKLSLVGGGASLISYGTALWAMTLAPIAVIAALRETAILFGVLLATLLLHERLGARRAVGVLLLVIGAIMMRIL